MARHEALRRAWSVGGAKPRRACPLRCVWTQHPARLCRPGRKSRSLTEAQRSQSRGSSNSVSQCLSEKPSSPFDQRLPEPGTLSFLLQTFTLFVANPCFRSCGRIPEYPMGNPQAARPSRGLQDRGTRAVNPSESSKAEGSGREGDAPAEPPCCRWGRNCKRGSTGISPSRDERGHSGRPPDG